VSPLIRKPPLDVYVILDPTASGGRDLREILKSVIAGGGRMVQLRDKITPMRTLLPYARELRRLAHNADVTFVVNDRVDLALALDADGLHVGQDDLPAKEARRLLGDRVVGVSSHSLTEALEAEADGADYVAVGSIFPTHTKAEFTLVGLELLRLIRERCSVPLVAIGGITAENIGEVIKAGADGAAVISAVGAAPDPERATRQLVQAVRDAKAIASRSH